tara:strand:+ start:777 stop:1082 length:306 start_codon:yes stop_codon:yes gene_type:complete
MVMREMPAVISAILKGMFRDVLKHWWRYIFTFLASLCIISTTTPVGLPLILEIPWGIVIMIISVNAILGPVWRAEYVENMYEELTQVVDGEIIPAVLGQET